MCVFTIINQEGKKQIRIKLGLLQVLLPRGNLLVLHFAVYFIVSFKHNISKCEAVVLCIQISLDA